MDPGAVASPLFFRVAEVIQHPRLGPLLMLDPAEAEKVGVDRLRQLEGTQVRVSPGHGDPSFVANIKSVAVTTGLAGRLVAGFQLQGSEVPSALFLPVTAEIL